MGRGGSGFAARSHAGARRGRPHRQSRPRGRGTGPHGAGPSGNFRHRRSFKFQPSDGPAASWGCSARDSGRTLRSRGDRTAVAGRKIEPFHYFDKGSLATIGRAAAVADFGWVRLSGLPAWIIWIFVHLLYIVEFQNRLLVLVQWAWLYVTQNRAARLITGKSPFPLDL